MIKGVGGVEGIREGWWGVSMVKLVYVIDVWIDYNGIY